MIHARTATRSGRRDGAPARLPASQGPRRIVSLALVTLGSLTPWTATITRGGERAPVPAWSPAELRMLRALSLGRLGPVPEDPSNRFAGNPRAAALGRRIFTDPRFSDNGQVACVTCHQPSKYFTDGLPRSRGIGETNRGAPSLIGTAYSPWLYWDGRRDNHWSQALVPLETPAEHGFDRRRILRVIAADEDYRRTYEAIFGALPQRTASARAIDQAFANVGKAVAAFERGILPTPARFDRYVETLGKDAAKPPKPSLTSDEIAGLRLFISEKAQCTRCHNGPLFTNFGFHNIGLVEPKRGVTEYDFGRRDGIKEALTDPFRCNGDYSDAKPGECVEEDFSRTSGAELISAFKVPTLRNVARTAPYMHDGRFETLEEVLEHYRKPPIGRSGHQELNPLELSDRQLLQLIAFLRTLTGSVPVL